MSYSDAKFQTATKLFNQLFLDHYIEKREENKELYESYYDTDVKGYLTVLTEQMGFATFTSNNRIYMYATNDSLHLPSNAECISKIKGAKKLSDLYLVYIIFIVFMSEMFSGQNAMELKRDFISVDDLIVATKNKFDGVSYDTENIDIDTKINFRSAKEKWDSLIIEFGNTDKTTSNTRLGFVTNAMNFFQNHDLVSKNTDTPIVQYRPTRKLKDFVATGQFNIDRFNEILTTLEEESI